MLMPRTGGKILVDALCTHGAELVFGVPGESYLAVLDALHDAPLRFITNRQEGGAAFMADAYGKMTGRPGLCFVTRGPGASNAAIGVHTAFQDSTPLILFIGQVGNDFVEREAFQEIDYRRMFGQMSKWVAQIDRAERIPEYVARAFQVATSGRPGPVVLALPEDMLCASAAVADARAYQAVQAAPAPSQMAQVRAEFEAWQAEPPVFRDGSAKLNLWQVVQTLQATLPPGTILTNGAGNFATWAHRFWRYGDPSSGWRTQLAPTSGAMGYGVPAAIAARLIEQQRGNPRSVLNFAGDGDFLMNGQELATAVQYGAGVLFIVFNNSSYGTIRMHQERHYPARVSGTQLHNPDFAALARAYGAHGETVETTAAFAPALERAQAHIAASGLPALIELRYDSDLITPNATLRQIRQAAQAAQAAPPTA